MHALASSVQLQVLTVIITTNKVVKTRTFRVQYSPYYVRTPLLCITRIPHLRGFWTENFSSQTFLDQ